MNQAEHSEHLRSNTWLLGGVAATSAVILSPYILPSLGFGPHNSLEQIVGLCNNSGTFGTGLADGINEVLNGIPAIGPTLAAGGWASVLTSGIIGLGGGLLGDYVHKKYDRAGHIPWGRVIKYTAIATSMLIALPSLLGGLTMGIGYLAYLVGGIGFASDALGAAAASLGLMGGMSVASIGAGISGFLPHLLTCGAAILPVGLTTFLSGRQQGETPDTQHPMDAGAFALVSASPISKDQPCQMAFRLRDPATGLILTPRAIKTTHTEKLHLMLVDQTLQEYHHIHPTYDATSGLFTCEFTPHTQQPFTVWCDFTPESQQTPVQARAIVPATQSYRLPARISTTRQVTADGITAHIMSDSPLTAGRGGVLRVQLRDASGQPITALGPTMGAYGHLAGFSADTQHFIHAHPLTALGQPIENGTLEFHITPKQAGLSKFFLQVNYQGREVIIPFGRVIAPALSHTDKLSAPARGGHQHAMA